MEQDIRVRLSHGVKALDIDDMIPTLVTRHADDVAGCPGLTSAFRLDGRDVLYMATSEEGVLGRVVLVCLEPEWRALGEHPWASDTPWPGDN